MTIDFKVLNLSCSSLDEDGVQNLVQRQRSNKPFLLYDVHQKLHVSSKVKESDWHPWQMAHPSPPEMLAFQNPY